MTPTERAKRLLEEAVELAQAAGVSKLEMISTVEYVNSRLRGEQAQEVGGVGVTLLAFAQSIGVDAHEQIEREISRIESLPPEKFRERSTELAQAGLSEYRT